MKKLTMKTKPKKLTLSEVWELYLLDTGEETSEFIIRVLDLCYPKLSRDNMEIMDTMKKYFEAKSIYSIFLSVTQGLVGNG
jgi:hypothetical protein